MAFRYQADFKELTYLIVQPAWAMKKADKSSASAGQIVAKFLGAGFGDIRGLWTFGALNDLKLYWIPLL